MIIIFSVILSNIILKESIKISTIVGISIAVVGLILVNITTDKSDKKNNKVLGFIIIKDNIRKNAKETLDYFKKQNVNIKIISGDNPITVSNLLKQLDIDNYDKYISGIDLPDDYNELRKIVNNYTIFGRVTPSQKKQIVSALRE